MNTLQTVKELKENGQDYEWYPTTNEMIFAVLRCIPKDADSILDIGAGDGRVLARFSEKCEDATLYSIEKSMVLTQAQPQNIVPIGTDIFEQNLSCLSASYIFCNPPYSQFEEWACKIIAEGYARKAFLVIPKRWSESGAIEKAMKLRGASSRVIWTGDFLHAERAARASVDIVEVSFPSDKWGDKVKDPFDIWFDQNIDTFDKAKEPEEDDAGRDLARKYSGFTIDEMVAAYGEEYARLESNYRAIFKLDYEILRELGVNKDHVREGLKKKMAGLKVKYWKILFDRLDAITSRLTTKSKNSLLEKLNHNSAVEFTASNAYAVVLWAIKNANKYFDEQLIKLFQDLSTFEGVMLYKSNQKTWGKDQWRYLSRWDLQQGKALTNYSLDYRIVVMQYHAINNDPYGWEYTGNLHKSCHELVADVVAVLSNLGFSTYSSSSLQREWEGGKWQDFYESNSDEILFQVKGYLNGNLHFRFMPDAIKALNVEAGRLLKWIRTEEDVITELGYTRQEAKKYFRSNAQLLASNVKLLAEHNPA